MISSSVTAPPLIAAERDVDRHVARSVGWQAAKVAVQIAQYIVLARLVVPAEYGKVALVLPVLAVFTALNDGGLSTAAVTGKDYDERLASDLYLTQLGLGAAMAGLMAGVAPLLAWVYGVPDLQSIGLWLALCLLVNAWGLQPRAQLRRHLRIGALALVDIAGVVAGLAAALSVAPHLSGVGVLVVAQVTNVAVAAIFAMTLAPVPFRRFQGDASYRHALRIGWHMVGSDVLNSARNQFPALAIGLFVVLHEVGLFNRANQLLNLPLLVLAPAMTNFLLPLLSRSRGSPDQFRRHVRRTLQLFLAATVPVCVWIALGPADLLALVLGEEWRPVVPLLSSLSPLFVVQIIAVVSMMTLVSSERSRTVRRFAFWNLGSTIVAVLVTAPFGAIAMAIGLSASGVLLRAPLVVRFAIREGTLQFADVREAMRLLLLLAAGTGVALWSCRLLPVAPVTGEIAGLVVAGLISSAVLFSIVRPRAPETVS